MSSSDCSFVRFNAPKSIAAIVQKYVDALSVPAYAFMCQWLQNADLERIADGMIDQMHQTTNSIEGCTLDAKNACPTKEAISAYTKCHVSNMPPDGFAGFPMESLLEDVLTFYFEVYCGGKDRKPDRKNLVALLEDVRKYACAYKEEASCGRSSFLETYRWHLVGLLACLLVSLVAYYMMTRGEAY
jgi:hypothetical protein